jgi:hypothetical protein
MKLYENMKIKMKLKMKMKIFSLLFFNCTREVLNVVCTAFKAPLCPPLLSQMATTFELPEDGTAPVSLEELNARDLTFDEPAFALSAGEQGDYDSQVLRITYSSLTTPRTVIDEHMGTGNRQVTAARFP